MRKKISKIGFISLAIPFFLFAEEQIPQTDSFSSLKSSAMKAISLQDRYSKVLDAMQKGKWRDLIKEGKAILTEHPNSAFNQDISYYMGIAYFYLQDYEMANDYFTKYLKGQTTPQYFEDVIGYKFSIAQKFEQGARRHVFGMEKMPKWMSGKETALSIYDEVITSLPRSDLAAQALYRKGYLLYQINEYKQGIEAFQSLIRRFPKHSLAPDSYLGICQIYLKQCQKQFPDPDFLDLAEINLKKFKLDFPGESRVAKAEEMLSQMKDRFAKELYDIGKFYQRTKKTGAAAVYYKMIVIKYPQTQFAIKSKKRLIALNEPLPSADENTQKKPEGLVVEGQQPAQDSSNN